MSDYSNQLLEMIKTFDDEELTAEQLNEMLVKSSPELGAQSLDVTRKTLDLLASPKKKLIIKNYNGTYSKK